MDINFIDADTDSFDPEMYVRILVAITKADRFNGSPEVEYVRRQAARLPVDFVKIWNETDKNLSIGRMPVSRLTAMVILKDCITLGSLDGNFSAAEKERVYSYAAKLDIPHADVKRLEAWLDACAGLKKKWDALINRN